MLGLTFCPFIGNYKPQRRKERREENKRLNLDADKRRFLGLKNNFNLCFICVNLCPIFFAFATFAPLR